MTPESGETFEGTATDPTVIEPTARLHAEASFAFDGVGTDNGGELGGGVVRQVAEWEGELDETELVHGAGPDRHLSMDYDTWLGVVRSINVQPEEGNS